MLFMKKFLIVFDTIDNFDIIETLFGSWAGDARLLCAKPRQDFCMGNAPSLSARPAQAWRRLVRQLRHLIKIRVLYLATRRYVEYENFDRLLLPLRRQPVQTPSPTAPRTLVPSAPLASQALLFCEEDAPRTRSNRRQRGPREIETFAEFIRSRPIGDTCVLRG